MGGQRECVCGKGRSLYLGLVWDYSKCVCMGKGPRAWNCGVLQRRWVEFVLKCLMNSMYSMCVESFQVM